MHRQTGRLLAVNTFLIVLLSSQAHAEQSAAPSMSARELARHRTTIKRYCVTCHNKKRNTANVNLEVLNFDDITEHAEIWEKMVHKVRTGEMPPPGKRRPPRLTREQLLDWMVASLDRMAQENPHPGRPAVHRLNRREYANAIRDLLGMEVDVDALLPADGSDFGFDNIADSLNMSPLLLERYIMVASKISRLAIGDKNVRASTKIYKLPKLLQQFERMSDDLPFGSRGGQAVRHHFPVDGEYAIKVNVQSDGSDQDLFQRSVSPEQLDVRVDGMQVGEFTIGKPKSRSDDDDSHSDKDQVKGEKQKSTWWGTRTYEVRFPSRAGTRQVAVSFLSRTLAYEGVRPDTLPPFYRTFFIGQQQNHPGVESLEILGPYNSTGVEQLPSRDNIFTSYPQSAEEELPVAREILSKLARLAYRRPLTERDVEILTDFYHAGHAKGDFESGIRFALERILISPSFLFRVETPPADIKPGQAFELSDLDLASRLSFFLWSSIPDGELLSLAEHGELRDPVIIEQQVQRMLADQRSAALVQNFATQWLHLRNVDAITPNTNKFPQFDDNLRHAFRRETELFVLSQLQQDRPVTELLSADYTYLNERLARHYGIPKIGGSHFRRVDMSNMNRQGLLGHGSILTVTSYATRTSPVRRGKWLLENILGSPPPPPPADVPDLPEVGVAGENATMRERMDAHLKDPTCASCHVKMDPLGFALENYDAIGQWRTHEAGLPIDSNGELADGTVINSPTKLRDVLLSTEGEFVRTVTQKLLTYALGRGLEYYDQPAVREITRKAKQGDARWSSIILGIIQSTPFQQRTAG